MKCLLASHVGGVRIPFFLVGALLSSNGTAQVLEDHVLTTQDATFQDYLGQVVSATESGAMLGEYNQDDGQGGRGAVQAFTLHAGAWQHVQQVTCETPTKQFGYWLGCSDNFLVASTPLDGKKGYGSGAAWAFNRQSGVWTQAQKLQPDELERTSGFGSCLAIDGDRVVIGAYGLDAGDRINHGGGYVYKYDSAGWKLEDKLLPPHPPGSKGAAAGFHCALDGDTLTLSAYGYPGKHVFVYERVGGEWTLAAVLKDPTHTLGDEFGWHAVAIEGSTIAVGETTTYSSVTSGSVFIYERAGAPPDNWILVQEIKASNNVSHDRFGNGIDIRGDRMLVGAPWGSKNGLRTGTAYLFERTLAGWIEVAWLAPSKNLEWSEFGSSVALAQSHAVIGVPLDDPVTAGVYSGSAHVFELPFGLAYCDAEPNSTGNEGLIEARGSVAAAAATLDLSASSLPANETGMFLVSRDPAFVSHPGGSAGNLCLGGDVGRFAMSVGSTGSGGTLSWTVDTGAIPVHPPVGIQPGETWRFQAWHRDGSTSNFTPGLEVQFE